MKVSKLVIWIGVWFAFCNVVLAMDKSVIDKLPERHEQEYQEVVAQSETDSLKPFFYYISKKPAYSWPALISQSFSDPKPRITTADIIFAIEQNSLLSTQVLKNNKSLFELAVLDRLRNKDADKRNAIVLLLTDANIKRAAGWITDKFDSEMTVLIACLEDGHIDAFTSILRAWPIDAKNPLAIKAITTTTKVGYFWNGTSVESTSLNLVQWLTRSEACYMAGSYVKANYIKAAPVILQFGQERNYEDAFILSPFVEDSQKEWALIEASEEPLADPVKVITDGQESPLPEVSKQEVVLENRKDPVLSLDFKPESEVINNNSPYGSMIDEEYEPRGIFEGIDDLLDNLANLWRH